MTLPSHGAEHRIADSVLITDQLRNRPARPLDDKVVNAALVRLAQVMANAPETILQRVVETALELCQADSCGISLLSETDAQPVFRWVAVAGGYAPFLRATLPRHSSPCGTVLDTDSIQLMRHPERHYTNLPKVEPPC